MDNLTSHHHPMVMHLIAYYGHQVVFRAPYRPVDGPIEYVFNTIQCILGHRMFKIETQEELEQHVHAIIRSIPRFDAYFEHCGYEN